MQRRNLIIAVIAVVAIVIVAVAALTIVQQPAKTVKYTVIAPKDQQAAIASGQVAGGISWEPYCSDSLLAETGKALIWSGDIWPNHPCCVIVVDKTFLADHPDLVLKVLKAHIEANKWIEQTLADPTSENYSLLLNIGADFSKRSTDVVKASLEHMTLTYNMSGGFNDYMKTFTNEFIKLNQTSTNAINTAGYSSVDDFVSKYVNSSYLADAASVQPETGDLATVRVGYLTGDLHQFARVVAENKTVGGGKSLFETYGIQTEASSPGGYAKGPDEMDAFKAGAVDIGYLGAPPAILKHINAGVNTLIISGVNEEGSALIVKNTTDINEFADLEGKTIASPGLGSIQHLLLQAIADKYGFKVAAA
jgi:NitT/TauT family transport system substrate-binding protein